MEEKTEYMTIDEWADNHPLFLSNVESAIKNLTDLEGDDAYMLRRVIMTFARVEFDG